MLLTGISVLRKGGLWIRNHRGISVIVGILSASVSADGVIRNAVWFMQKKFWEGICYCAAYVYDCIKGTINEKRATITDITDYVDTTKQENIGDFLEEYNRIHDLLGLFDGTILKLNDLSAHLNGSFGVSNIQAPNINRSMQNARALILQLRRLCSGISHKDVQITLQDILQTLVKSSWGYMEQGASFSLGSLYSATTHEVKNSYNSDAAQICAASEHILRVVSLRLSVFTMISCNNYKLCYTMRKPDGCEKDGLYNKCVLLHSQYEYIGKSLEILSYDVGKFSITHGNGTSSVSGYCFEYPAKCKHTIDRVIKNAQNYLLKITANELTIVEHLSFLDKPDMHKVPGAITNEVNVCIKEQKIVLTQPGHTQRAIVFLGRDYSGITSSQVGQEIAEMYSQVPQLSGVIHFPEPGAEICNAK